MIKNIHSNGIKMNHKLRQSIRRVGCIVAVSGFLCVLCLRIAHNIKSFLISSFWCNSMRSTWNQIAWRSACIRNLSLVFFFLWSHIFCRVWHIFVVNIAFHSCMLTPIGCTHTHNIYSPFVFVSYLLSDIMDMICDRKLVRKTSVERVRSAHRVNDQ